MGVVDDNAEGLAHVDALHAAGHAVAGGDTAADRLGLDAQGKGGTGCGERVGDVEERRHADLGADLRAGKGEAEAAAVGVQLDVAGGDVDAGRLEAVADGTLRGEAEQEAGGRVVGVGDGGPAGATGVRSRAAKAGPWPRGRPRSSRGSRGGHR